MNISSCLLAALVILLFSDGAKADPVPERITLKNGVATVEGSVIRGERNVYLLSAEKGQKLDISIQSEEKNAVFTIALKGSKTAGAEDGDGATQLKTTLSKSGDYAISVGGSRGNASYTLKISLE